MIRPFLICAALLGTVLYGQEYSAAQDPQEVVNVIGETKEQFQKRMKWWNDARFGVFIHWGLYSIPAGEWKGETVPRYGEWIIRHGKIAIDDYAPLIDQFNPTKFDANEWMSVIKNSGAKYFVITTKHHEGFSLFRTKRGEFNITNTPFGLNNDRDIMKELSFAARKQGVKVGWYYSILDWHNPNYAPQKGFLKHKNQNPDFEKYVEFMTNQTTELLTNYGEIDILWYDGEWDKTWTDERGNNLYKYIRELAPNIIVNNRVGKERTKEKIKSKNKRKNKETIVTTELIAMPSSGDFGTPEQKLPPNGFEPGVYWETCMTMNKTWGYRKDDHDWKSTETLIRQLIDASSKGGNYLLNVGPKADGTIPQESIDRLNEIGKWLEVNGEAIYGTQAGVLGKKAWGRSTTKTLDNGNTALYLHLFDLPKDNKIALQGYAEQFVSLAAISAKSRDVAVTYTVNNNDLIIEMPESLWNEYASVIKVELKQIPKNENAK
ncbi:alpha-L-fucosidase [Planctomycetota bacterium]|nr:alpha-L-fucosidase [Planctomycetota bacterium]